MNCAPRLRSAIAGLVLMPFGALSGAAPAAADQIATRFEVFGFAGIRVLSLRSRTDENGAQYAISVEYRTQGMARMFVDLTTRAQVQGRLVEGAAQPEWFRNDASRNGVERHSRVDYRPDGAVVAASTPAPPDPITPQAARGTVDNLTAYFRLERQLAAKGSCALTDRVFDGRHRYDLVFTDVGRKTLAPSGGQNFAGEAIACHMTRHIRDGMPNAERDEGARSGTIWYARLISGDLMVPVRMQLDTQLGSVDGYLAELHGRGVDRAFME
ncbi:MAG TPA: DUF3108 domain-containing protein [Stellaceae bacterium]|nr:DUF3108 domain-containing protein [Stellaceae bacterium]